MSFEPPAVPPSYQPPAQPQYQPPAQPQYGNQPAAQPQPQQPTYAQPQYQPPAQYGAANPQSSGTPPRPKNMLGLLSVILGAAGFLLTFVFTFIQIGMISSGQSSLYGVVGGVQTAFDVVLGLGAVGLGLFVILRKGAPKVLAAAGLALGAALIVEVLNGLLYSVVLPLLY